MRVEPLEILRIDLSGSYGAGWINREIFDEYVGKD